MLTRSWSSLALLDFDQAQSYIAADNPAAARRVAERIRNAVRLLQKNPGMGRQADVPDTRIWVVPSTPYLIAYRVRAPILEIVRLWHSSRDWQHADD